MDSKQFMNSILDSLAKNVSDNDFKYLSEEFSGEFLECIDMNIWTVLKSFLKPAI